MNDSIEFCNICKTEFEIKYSMIDETQIVSQTRCKCIKRDVQNPKQLDQALLKLKEVLNEKRIIRNESIPTNQRNPIKD